MPKVATADIHLLSERALARYGAALPVAAEMARAITWAEARDNRICGLYYLESYCLQLRSGRVDGAAQVRVTQPRASEVRIDAAHGFAQPAFAQGLAQAVAAAEQTGITLIGIHNAHTCTALGYFTEQIARAGCIGLGFTNASPIVAAPGGKTRVLGTNPMSFAVPDGAGGLAMLFDQSTTTTALGRITMAKAAGQPIPPGWAVDCHGKPTTDPEAALAGSLTSSGGYKGWGLGLMVEILAACLTGGTLSADVKPLKAPQGVPHDLGQTFVLIHAGSEGIYDRIARLAEIVSQDDGARMPGRHKHPATHVDVPEDLWRQIRDLSGSDAPA